MSDETKEAKPAETPPAPAFMTKDQVEAMLAAQTQQFAGMFQRLTETLQAGQTKPAPAAEPKKALSFYDNPEQAASALIDQKLQPVRDAYISNELNRQLGDVMALPHAADYADEIKAVLSKIPGEAAVQPGAVREVYHMVLGRHVTDVTKKQAEAEARKPEFTETATSASAPARRSEALSAEETRAAEGMGMPPDEYRKWRDKRTEMTAAALKRS